LVNRQTAEEYCTHHTEKDGNGWSQGSEALNTDKFYLPRL